MIRVTDNHLARLLRMNPARIMPAVGEELRAGAEAIAEDARASVLDGGIPSPHHVVSAPGEAPNSDSGYLVSTIHAGEIIETPGTVQTSVGVGAEYGLYLELGTSQMKPRPFLVPATELNRKDVIDALHKRFEAEVIT